jgi:hypothetical protein
MPSSGGMVVPQPPLKVVVAVVAEAREEEAAHLVAEGHRVAEAHQQPCRRCI